MSCLTLVNEGSEVTLQISFFDIDGLPVIPASATYEVLCMTTTTTVRAEAAMTGLNEVTDLTLYAEDNTIQDADNEREQRRVIVRSYGGASEPYYDAFDYWVRALS